MFLVQAVGPRAQRGFGLQVIGAGDCVLSVVFRWKGFMLGFKGLIPSRKLTWKPKKGPLKTTVPLKWGYMGFHVSFGECMVWGLFQWDLAAKKRMLRVLLRLLPTKWGFPKIRGTLLGVPMIRIIVFWGLYLGAPILGNYQISEATNTVNIHW